MLKKIALLILISVFLVGCATVPFKPLIPENTIPFIKSQDESPVDFQAKMERAAELGLLEGERAEIRYIGDIKGMWYIKIYDYKDEEWQFSGWKFETPKKELQKSWELKGAWITIYYKPCR